MKEIAAVFDGKVFHLAEPITLPANTRVKIIIETLETDEPETNSFLQTARSLNLEGPSDWSVKLDRYLYCKETTEALTADEHFQQAGFRVLLRESLP